MLIFERLSWRNFLSTGDTPTVIDLNDSPSTLITGKNGSGKSTFLDALTFALFGKPHRSINKPQLVNSINKKNCEVEITFSIGVKKYRVVRGMYPSKFEIYEGDKLVPQPSTTKDYQRFLEQSVLRLNYKTFNQVVVLGSSSFVPFMQLSTGQRRHVVEDLLDINVFTRMNQLIREQNSKVKSKYTDLDYRVSVEEEKSKVQTKFISNLESLNDGMIAEKTQQIEDKKTEGVELQKKLESLKVKIKSGEKIHKQKSEELQKKRSNLLGDIGHIKSQINSFKKQAKFFEQNSSCPSCTQPIDDELKHEMTDKLASGRAVAEEQLNDFGEVLSSLDADIKTLEEIYELISADRKLADEHTSEMNAMFRLIQQLQSDIIQIQKKTDDIDDAKKELRHIEESIATLRSERAEAAREIEYNAVMIELLKDSGIKTKIIKQYIEPLNAIINQYLQVLDFFVHFDLDENFNEQIRSRHRDIFSYFSFSEGEKQRIDLSVLFAFRQIAKMKNSVNTNLLILDETFDSSLDVDGVDNLLTILDTLDTGTNVFVISHKGHLLAEKFMSGLTFEKQSNFSVMRKG